jgi:hypothetical protein
MRTQFNARYVRLYAWCIRKGFLDDVIKAGYEAGIGVYAVIWFGYVLFMAFLIIGSNNLLVATDLMPTLRGSTDVTPYSIP